MENSKIIRAVYNNESIRVYQAYNEIIATEAIRNGTFGKSFKRDRMTWIKPSFLWMMYRCGWASKENQEYVLAIDMKREAFDHLVNNAVISKYDEKIHGSYEEWKMKIHNSDIRVQWDPERDIYGNPLEYRSIQIGIRGHAVERYVNEWIVSITDITAYVKELRKRIIEKQDIWELIPAEKEYQVKRKSSKERN